MKNKLIFAGKDGRPSMKQVYEQMTSGTLKIRRRFIKNGIVRKEYIRVYTDNNSDFYTKEKDFTFNDSIVIRWGNRIEAPTNNNTIVYNKIEAVNKATNKKRSREIFLNTGVKTPRLYTIGDDNITFPIVARPLVHSKGRNFLVLNSQDEFAACYHQHGDNYYYSEFIDKDREYRVHCAHGKILAVMEKPPVDGIAWNRAVNHEAFVRVMQKEYNYDVCFQALKAVNELGLDFGGVDVIVKDGQAFVLEVNTSPTLNSSEYTSYRYAQYFDWLFRSEQRRDHWDYTAFKKADSFAWKQIQLERN